MGDDVLPRPRPSLCQVLKLYAEIEERFPEFIGPDMMLPTIAAMCQVGREEETWPALKRLPEACIKRNES